MPKGSIMPPILVYSDIAEGSRSSKNAPNDDRQPRITTEESHVKLEADDEQEEHETDIGDQGKERPREDRENVVREAWDMSADGRTEQDAAYDFRDDLGLADSTEQQAQGLREDDDDAQLDNEQSNLLAVSDELDAQHGDP